MFYAVFQPKTLRDPEVQAELIALKPDVAVVAAYGRILPKEVLDAPKYGCLNIHASLLPRYRGASPIMHAIADMQKSTGVCFMDMEIGLDSGKVYKTIEYPLDGTEYADALEVRLGEIAAGETLQVLEDIASGVLAGVPQNPELATMTTKIKKSDGVIDWSRTNSQIFNHVRGMNPWPCAFTGLNGKTLKIMKARAVDCDCGKQAGTVVCADINNGLKVACGAGCLQILELQLEGSKKMPARDFLLGRKINVGDILKW